MTGEWESTAPLPPVVDKVEPKTPPPWGEINNLHRWKREALPLLEQLERCHDLLPESAKARLGCSEADAVENYLSALRRGTDPGTDGPPDGQPRSG